MQMRVRAAEPHRNKFTIMNFLPKDESEEKPKKKAKTKSGAQKSVLRDISDQELQLSDDEEVQEEPVIDHEKLKQMALEAARLEKLEQEKALHKKAAAIVEEELEAMMEAANLASPARKTHIEKQTDSDLSEKQDESQEEDAEAVEVDTTSIPGADHIVKLGKSLASKTDQKEKRRKTMAAAASQVKGLNTKEESKTALPDDESKKKKKTSKSRSRTSNPSKSNKSARSNK